MRTRIFSCKLLVALLIVWQCPHGPSWGAELEAGRDAHVFQRGAPVTFPVPEALAASTRSVRFLNERMEEYAVLPAADSTVEAGALPVGWYRVEFLDEGGALLGFTTAAVIAPLAEAPSPDSPISLDVALAWLGAKDQGDWPLMAQLARLAGAGWVRDRIHWREIQEESGAFIPHTKYDDSAEIQAAEGLQILQVFHTRPKWAVAGAEGERPRTDLLKLYAFCKGMAERFQGRVQAWEPWNEGNAGNFGGFTIDELCSLQKAAWLGFKAGDPALTVCWNPLGGINRATQVEDLLRNETWPYFDVYSIHSYDWPHAFEGLWEHARNAASGRPIWVTEGDRGMTADPASASGDFTPEMDRRKAEFVAQSYVRSLFSGASRHFHFVLGHYMEGENRVQFGLLREDHTPRPSYVALATVGRLLAGAQGLGLHEIEGQPDIQIYAFRARPQGVPRDVLVAWTEREGDWPQRGEARAAWPLSEGLHVEAAFDYLGRPLAAVVPAHLSPAAVFLVLAPGESEKVTWRAVPAAARREGTPSPIVFQFDAPGAPPILRTEDWTQEAAYEFSPGATVESLFTVYNAAAEPVRGTVTLENLPPGWRVEPTLGEIRLDAMGRQEIPLHITIPAVPAAEDVWLTFRGNFGTAGKPVLAIRNRAPRQE